MQNAIIPISIISWLIFWLMVLGPLSSKAQNSVLIYEGKVRVKTEDFELNFTIHKKIEIEAEIYYYGLVNGKIIYIVIDGIFFRTSLDPFKVYKMPKR